MEIERKRGISVSTAVMSFEYDSLLISILDTPGHKDFAEDTYRTLTAVDSVKGVEEQTEKLLQVCRLRHTPVIIFVNKMDREGKRPLELLDEMELKLDIAVRPLSWPIGGGSGFKGVHNLHDRNLYLFQTAKTTVEQDRRLFEDLADPRLDQELGSDARQLREDVELVEGIHGPFCTLDYLAGRAARGPAGGRSRRKPLHRLRFQDPRQSRSQPPRPDRLPAGVLRPFRTKHTFPPRPSGQAPAPSY